MKANCGELEKKDSCWSIIFGNMSLIQVCTSYLNIAGDDMYTLLGPGPGCSSVGIMLCSDLELDY